MRNILTSTKTKRYKKTSELIEDRERGRRERERERERERGGGGGGREPDKVEWMNQKNKKHRHN